MLSTEPSFLPPLASALAAVLLEEDAGLVNRLVGVSFLSENRLVVAEASFLASAVNGEVVEKRLLVEEASDDGSLPLSSLPASLMEKRLGGGGGSFFSAAGVAGEDAAVALPVADGVLV